MAQVDQVEPVGAEGWREETTQRVEIGGAGAAHGDVHVASGAPAAVDRRAEPHDQLEVEVGREPLRLTLDLSVLESPRYLGPSTAELVEVQLQP